MVKSTSYRTVGNALLTPILLPRWPVSGSTPMRALLPVIYLALTSKTMQLYTLNEYADTMMVQRI